MNELADFAGQICESLCKTSGKCTAIADRDSIIAVCGINKRELYEKPISGELEQIMEARQLYSRRSSGNFVAVSSQNEKYHVSVAAPIITEGDVMGCVLFVSEKGSANPGEVEYKLAQTVAAFLGKQMES